MQDQQFNKISNFYKEKIDQAIKYLEHKYHIEECDKSNEDYPQNITTDDFAVRRIKFKPPTDPPELILAIPKTFPDSLPKFYLTKKDHERIFPIPHVDTNRFVCTRDSEVVAVNEDLPGEAIGQLIEIALREIIESGIKKENFNHFIEEFLAYWNDGARYRFISIYTPSDQIEELFIIELQKKFAKTRYVIAKSKEQAVKWLSSFNLKINEEKIRKALYLPFSGPINPLFPKNNREAYQVIENAGEEFINAVQQYFIKRNDNLIIIFSFPVKEEKLVAGWCHVHWKREIFRGFRKYSLPLKTRMDRSGTKNIKKVQIERVDRERLFNRGGIGIRVTNINTSTAIVGCGSIGSNLTLSLAKCGIAKFCLIDKEFLGPENVARHICGLYEVGLGLKKSEAVMKRLLNHFPNIDCETYEDDILNVLMSNESLLNKYDIVVIATGKLSVERRINHLLKRGIINSPVIFIWLEPYGVGGHVLYVHPTQGGCYLCCFNKDGTFKFSITRTDDKFEKRECGCQTTFTPYSNLEIDHFISIACGKIIDFLEAPPNSSFLYTWLGNLPLFKSLGYKLSDQWIADSAYTLHKREIEKNRSCSICATNQKI